MNLNVGNIFKTAQAKADWIAALLSIHERFDGNWQTAFDHFTSKWALHEVQVSFSSIDHLKWKLWNSPHLSTSLFRLGLMARIGVELGFLPSKYKKLTEKVMTGAGVAAITMPASMQAMNAMKGSGPTPSGSKGSYGSGHSPSWGYKP